MTISNDERLRRMRLYSKKWYLANQNKRMAQIRRWNDEHREEQNQKERVRDRTRRAAEKIVLAENKEKSAYIRLLELADHIPIRKSRLSTLASLGKLPTIKTPSGLHLIAKSDIEKIKKQFENGELR